jgi:hypothetical protein
MPADGTLAARSQAKTSARFKGIARRRIDPDACAAMKSTPREKIRKLRRLARSPNPHEAALAAERADALEAKLLPAKTIAREIARLLAARGLSVRVRTRGADDWSAPKVDAEVHYFVSLARRYQPRHRLKIEITDYEHG